MTAKLKKPMDDVSEELNLIASQNLDYAPARRRVRSAFIKVQQELDHPLFKVCLVSCSDHDRGICFDLLNLHGQ